MAALPKQPLLLALTLAALALTLALNQVYRQSLYTLGVSVIRSAQSHSTPLLDYFFMLVTMTIDPLLVFGGVVVLVVVSQHKQKAFIVFAYILLNTFVAALLKAHHCDPRPFWTSDSVRNIGIYCPVEYGNPSGHSWFSAVAGFGVLLQYKGAGIKQIVVSLLLVVLVPMSRMYLGAHSLNQVLQGLVLGLGMCVLFRLGIRERIHRFLVEFNHSRTNKLFIIGLHVLSVVPFVMHMDEQLPEQWLSNIRQKCGTEINETKLNQLMYILNALFINVLTGLAMGYEQLFKNHLGVQYLAGNWQINTNKFGRYKARAMYAGVELGCMLSGLALAAGVFKVWPEFAVGYLGVSCGGIVSGYVYATRPIRVYESTGLIVVGGGAGAKKQ